MGILRFNYRSETLGRYVDTKESRERIAALDGIAVEKFVFFRNPIWGIVCHMLF